MNEVNYIKRIERMLKHPDICEVIKSEAMQRHLKNAAVDYFTGDRTYNLVFLSEGEIKACNENLSAITMHATLLANALDSLRNNARGLLSFEDPLSLQYPDDFDIFEYMLNKKIRMLAEITKDLTIEKCKLHKTKSKDRFIKQLIHIYEKSQNVSISITFSDAINWKNGKYQNIDSFLLDFVEFSLKVFNLLGDDKYNKPENTGAFLSKLLRLLVKTVWLDFEKWCLNRKVEPLPAEKETVLEYLSHRPDGYSNLDKNFRRKAVIRAHKDKGYVLNLD